MGEIKRNPFLTQITFGESTDDINKKKKEYIEVKK